MRAVHEKYARLVCEGYACEGCVCEGCVEGVCV